MRWLTHRVIQPKLADVSFFGERIVRNRTPTQKLAAVISKVTPTAVIGDAVTSQLLETVHWAT